MPYSAERSGKKDIIAILVIFAVALTARVLYLSDYLNTAAYPLLAYSDGYSYFIWAKDIASGELLGRAAFMKWPLYAYFLGLLFKLSGANVVLVYLLQFTLGAANCVLVYLIARTIFNRTAAFLTGAFLALYAVFIFYEGLLIYTALSLFLNSLLFLFILHLRNDPGIKGFFLAGLLLGICTITQASILLFGLLAIPLLLWQERGRAVRPVCSVFSFLAGLFIVISAVTSANYLAEKDFVPVSGNIGINFYLGNNPDAGGMFNTPLFIAPNQEDMFRDSKIIAEARSKRRLKTSQVSAFWLNKALSFIRDDPRAYLKLLLKKTGYLFSPFEAIHDPEYELIRGKARVLRFTMVDLRFILPLAFIGAILAVRKIREAALLYLVLATTGFSVAMFFVTTRYRVAMVPFLAVFASFGAFGIWEAFRQRKWLKFGSLCAGLLMISLTVNYPLLCKDNIAYSEQRELDFHSHLSRAAYYKDRADYQRALDEIGAAYRIQPQSHYCLIAYGTIYYNMGDLKKAEARFKEALKAFPLSVDAYYNLGLLYNHEGRFEDAIKALNKAVGLDPEDAAAHFELGKAYKDIGHQEEARIELELALEKINRWRIQERAAIKDELAGIGI